MKLSARNKLAGTVSEVHRGEAIANVAIDVSGTRVVASSRQAVMRSSDADQGEQSDGDRQGLGRDHNADERDGPHHPGLRAQSVVFAPQT